MNIPLPKPEKIYKHPFRTPGDGILSTLLYFDLFSYPLTRNEIFKYCHAPLDSDLELDTVLARLVELGLVKHEGMFYFVNSSNHVVERRINGNLCAESALKRARFFSRLISVFPFVKAVFISGSLSKGYMDRNSDIDYFIITTRGRLWICRTLLVLFKKLFLFNSHRNFCVNYLVDQEHLHIPDHNLFTATELVTLLTFYHADELHHFFRQNEWTREFFPNLITDNIPESTTGKTITGEQKSYRRKRNVFDLADQIFFRLTWHFWRRKFKSFSDADFRQALRTEKGVSKHHPNNFQEKVLAGYQRALVEFRHTHRYEFDSSPATQLNS